MAMHKPFFSIVPYPHAYHNWEPEGLRASPSQYRDRQTHAPHHRNETRNAAVWHIRCHPTFAVNSIFNADVQRFFGYLQQVADFFVDFTYTKRIS